MWARRERIWASVVRTAGRAHGRPQTVRFADRLRVVTAHALSPRCKPAVLLGVAEPTFCTFEIVYVHGRESPVVHVRVADVSRGILSQEASMFFIGSS